MKVVYVTSRGGVLRRTGERLELVLQREVRSTVPLHDLGQLVVQGGVTITPAAIDAMLDRGVDVVLLSASGNYRGRIVTGASGNARLRLAQYDLARDPDRSLGLAKRIVAGKVLAQRRVLLRHRRRHGDTPELATADVALRAAAARAQLTTTLDELRGCEGSGAAAYFRVFGSLLRAEGFHFDGRNRRPPLDPVNALLSLGYTLLSNAVEAAVAIVGLDPHLGVLHAVEAGRPSLVCDLIEEHRAPVVDTLVLAAVNQAAVTPDDFEDMGEGEPVFVKREALRWFVTLFERKLARATPYAPIAKSLPWRQVFEQQARLYAREVLGKDRYQCHEVR